MSEKATANKNELRSSRMKRRVLEETLNCIYDLGLQNTSTVEITKRAGVSRGAMLHHFPSKEELFCAAFESQLKKEVEQLRDVAGTYAEGEVTLDTFFDYMWSRFTGRAYAITLDYLVAARTNPYLKSRVEKARSEYERSLRSIWSQTIVYDELRNPDAQAMFDLTLCLFRGMGLHTVTKDKHESLDALVSYWKAHLGGQISEKAEAASGRRRKR